jgi:hypothetical protein
MQKESSSQDGDTAVTRFISISPGLFWIAA